MHAGCAEPMWTRVHVASPLRIGVETPPAPGRPRSPPASATPAPCPGARRRPRCRRARLWRGRSGSLFEERLERGAEIGRRPAYGVDVGAETDAVFEAETVQLVKLLLRERERRGTCRREASQHLAHLLFEVGVLVHPGDQAQLRRLAGAEHAARGREVEGQLLSYQPSEDGHD